MKEGGGHAIFTAYCSHWFHCNCIASNVKHVNQVSTVCLAKWKEIPMQHLVVSGHGLVAGSLLLTRYKKWQFFQIVFLNFLSQK